MWPDTSLVLLYVLNKISKSVARPLASKFIAYYVAGKPCISLPPVSLKARRVKTIEKAPANDNTTAAEPAVSPLRYETSSTPSSTQGKLGMLKSRHSMLR